MLYTLSAQIYHVQLLFQLSKLSPELILNHFQWQGSFICLENSNKGEKQEAKGPSDYAVHWQVKGCVRLLTFAQPGDKDGRIEPLSLKLEINVGGHFACAKMAYQVSDVSKVCAMLG